MTQENSKIASLAKSLNFEEEFLHAVNLPENRVDDMLGQIAKSAKINKWIGVPGAGIALAALLMSSLTTLKDNDFVNGAFLLGIGGYVAGRCYDKAGRLRQDIDQEGKNRLIELHQQQTPKP